MEPPSLRFLLSLFILGAVLRLAELNHREVIGLERLLLSSSVRASLEGVPSPREVEVTTQRTEMRRDVIWRLYRGKLTLFEAAAWFQHLNATPSEYPNHGWRQFPGKSDEEKVCRQVIHYLEGHLGDIAPRREWEPFMQCLEQELEMQLASGGTLLFLEELGLH